MPSRHAVSSTCRLPYGNRDAGAAGTESAPSRLRPAVQTDGPWAQLGVSGSHSSRMPAVKACSRPRTAGSLRCGPAQAWAWRPRACAADALGALLVLRPGAQRLAVRHRRAGLVRLLVRGVSALAGVFAISAGCSSLASARLRRCHPTSSADGDDDGACAWACRRPRPALAVAAGRHPRRGRRSSADVVWRLGCWFVLRLGVDGLGAEHLRLIARWRPPRPRSPG